MLYPDSIFYFYFKLQPLVKFMMIAQKYQLIVLQPEGRLDLQGGKDLENQLTGLIPQQQDLWVIDLVNVDFIDSPGLLALVKVFQMVRNSGCRLVLCNLQTPVRLVFELTQLDTVLEIFDNYEEILTKINYPVMAA